MNLSPRVEIAPGIYAESVLKRSGAAVSHVYEVTGGVFDHFEIDSMSALAQLVAILSPLKSAGPPAAAPAAAGGLEAPSREPGHRRCELHLPVDIPVPATSHRRFPRGSDAAQLAQVWIAEALARSLPATEWAVTVLEQAVRTGGELVSEAMTAGATAVLLTLEVDGRSVCMTRFDELTGGLDERPDR